MITVRNLSKNYGSFQALKNVSFEVNKGEILGFLGPNGAGKTTTMKIITGYFPPSLGSVSIGGLSLEKNLIECKRKIGYLPENVPLYLDMRVMDFFSFVAQVKGVSRKGYKKQIDEIINDCNLGSITHKLIGSLSKGFRQRVGLAQALIGDPEVLILDEPTIGLDPKQIIEIRQLIKKMAGKKTVILCTHVLPEVSMVSDRVIIINEGQIVAIDTPDNLNTRLRSTNELLLIVDGAEDLVMQTVNDLSNVISVDVRSRSTEGTEYVIHTDIKSDIRHDLAKSIVNKRGKLRLLEMRAVSLSLEDIFLQLVTKERGVVYDS